MVVVSIALVFLFIVAFVSGYRDCYEFSIGVELNTLATHCYRIGITSERFVLEDGIEDEIYIGLFFVNIVITFYKDLPEENQA